MAINETCLEGIALVLLAEALDAPDRTDGRFAYGVALPGAEVVDRAGPLDGAGEEMEIEEEALVWFGAGCMLVGCCCCLNMGS